MKVRTEITSIVPLPEHINVLAEYKDEDEPTESWFERIYFVGIQECFDHETSCTFKQPVFVTTDSDGLFFVPDEVSNFVEYHYDQKHEED